MKEKSKREIPAYSRMVVAGFALAILLGLIELFAGLGTRWGLWNYRWGISLLRCAAYGGVAAGAISLAGCIVARPGAGRRGIILAACGFLIALAVSGVPWSLQHQSRQVPAIHDITTDPDDPPRFESLLSLRKAMANGAEYGGRNVASRQRVAYPDIVPLEVPLSPPAAFKAALSAARGLGWEVIHADEGSGLIEATATTFWFGFKDDVIVRIVPAMKGSRIDVRSVSRVGKSDLGTNANRIRKFFKSIRGT
jgi:uncharacterized protein (DUF1499 family)